MSKYWRRLQWSKSFSIGRNHFNFTVPNPTCGGLSLLTRSINWDISSGTVKYCKKQHGIPNSYLIPQNEFIIKTSVASKVNLLQSSFASVRGVIDKTTPFHKLLRGVYLDNEISQKGSLRQNITNGKTEHCCIDIEVFHFFLFSYSRNRYMWTGIRIIHTYFDFPAFPLRRGFWSRKI